MIRVLIGVFSFLCGYVMISWIPIPNPFSFSDLILEFILNPLLFFASMILFMVGFIMNSKLFKGLIEDAYLLLKGRPISNLQFVITIVLIATGYAILFKMGTWHTLLFLTFSAIYGIISLDFKENISLELDH